jgi:hypothetical protein
MSDLLSGTQWPAGLHIRRIGTFFTIFHGGMPVSVSFREEAAAKCTLDYWQEQMAAGIIRAAEGTFTPPPIEWKLPSPQRLVEAVAAAAEAERIATKARLAELEERLDAIRALVEKAARGEDLGEIKRHVVGLRRLTDRWSEGGSRGGDKSGEVRSNKPWHIHGRDFIAKNKAKAKSARDLAHKLEADLTAKGIEHPDLSRIENWTRAQFQEANSRK